MPRIFDVLLALLALLVLSPFFILIVVILFLTVEHKVFYLQTRGIGKESAQALLVEAFADEVLDKVDSEELRIWIKEKLG